MQFYFHLDIFLQLNFLEEFSLEEMSASLILTYHFDNVFLLLRNLKEISISYQTKFDLNLMLPYLIASYLSWVCVLSYFSCVQFFVTLWTVACQAPLSVGFSRQECWSGLPHLPPWDLLTQGLNPCLLCLLYWQVGSLPLVPSLKPTCPIYFTLFYTSFSSIRKDPFFFPSVSGQLSFLTVCHCFDGWLPGILLHLLHLSIFHLSSKFQPKSNFLITVVLCKYDFLGHCSNFNMM